ncbi:MAG: PH domain-containing protein [Lachnospiraceae bacterium]|nr:PH domain-containing protein [Lachnospiraceae bacterium]
MSKLSQNLQKNEEVVLEAKVHWACLIIPIVFSFIIIGIPYLISRLIAMKTTELSLSNKRLVGKYGLINTKQMDSPLNKINSVSVESGLFGKIFGYATITVNTASTIYNFRFIANAENVKHEIMEEMERFDEARIQEQARAIANAIK